MAIVKESRHKTFDTELNRYITYRNDKNHPYFKEMIYQCNKKRYDRLKAAKLCKECMSPVDDGNFVICIACRKKGADKVSDYKRRITLISYEKYGGAFCVCCGENEIKFLTIDHINNDGNIHRKAHPEAGPGIHSWLKKNNYPPGFQVLCWNCNLGKARNKGICPHKTKQG